LTTRNQSCHHSHMKKRPNILFLMSDQHRADLTGYEGNKVIRTPHLDWLAQSGVVFRNAYTPSPICVPARQAMMAGQLPKTCDCQGFWEDLTPGYMTFAKRFSQYAYNTVCSGKLHHHGPDQMQGWTKRISPDADLAVPFIEGKIEEEFARYDMPAIFGKWSNQRELEEAGPKTGPCQNFDKNATQASLEFLERYFKDATYGRPGSHRPLLHKVSLLQPHYPFFGEEILFNYYYDRVPVYLDKPCDHPVLSLSQQNKPVHASEEDIRRATASYYAMTEKIDTHFGDVLKRLQDLGEDLDEWIIVYTSDHGEMLGEHGIWEKTRFYEASARVPLIIRWPRGFEGGRIVEENVNLCDLFATLCDLAGLEIPAGLDSRSMVPLLKGDAADWQNESISQMNRNHLMIKQDSLKYQYYGEDIPEVLFDLAADPAELVNVADKPKYSEDMEKFRTRRNQLGHGPEGDSQYRNAGYCG
jgi:choline-sulfatase